MFRTQNKRGVRYYESKQQNRLGLTSKLTVWHNQFHFWHSAAVTQQIHKYWRYFVVNVSQFVSRTCCKCVQAWPICKVWDISRVFLEPETASRRTSGQPPLNRFNGNVLILSSRSVKFVVLINKTIHRHLSLSLCFYTALRQRFCVYMPRMP